jgi:hypothetical protein
MPTIRIDQLPQVKHHDVKPMYSPEDVLNKLASAVKFNRELDQVSSEQALELELMYSIAKAIIPTP